MDYGSAYKTKANKLPEPLKEAVQGFHRQALHAWLLAFTHPITEELMRFEAPLPEDMEQLLKTSGAALYKMPKMPVHETVLLFLNWKSGFCAGYALSGIS